MSYAELSIYGTLRKREKLGKCPRREYEHFSNTEFEGPYGMWSKLIHVWGDKLSPQQVYEKVRWFFW